jgi:hypothetical protein
MSIECSIGVVTYFGRFESYFKPLIKKLSFLFPDYDINVWINGHHDTVKQVKYLREVTAFLRNYCNIRYVTNLEHQPLARGWNWLILMSRCGHVLIFNDDVSVDWEFRHRLEHLHRAPKIFTLNNSWSHFVISKKIVRAVGWFDERFLGIGDEDGDYMCRLAMQGIPLGNIAIHGLHNFMAPQDDAGWAPLSGAIHGKYSRINREFLMKKWWRSDYGLVPKKGSFKVRYHEAEWDVALNTDLEGMPEYYPLECLQASENGKPGRRYSVATLLAQTCSWAHSLYWRLRLTAGGWLRRFFGLRWDE